jgi:hypothetical protein
MTLLALARQLTIFEEAVERGHGHPGFLLVYSPGKTSILAAARRHHPPPTKTK